jgi:hypothetical protein
MNLGAKINITVIPVIILYIKNDMYFNSHNNFPSFIIAIPELVLLFNRKTENVL